MSIIFSKETIAENLRAQRARKRLSQEQLAKMVGVNVQTIQNCENAQNVISLENAFNIANALDMTLNELVS